MQKKITTYHVEEKDFCEKHNIKMTQIPCSMYVYCAKCEEEGKPQPKCKYPDMPYDGCKCLDMDGDCLSEQFYVGGGCVLDEKPKEKEDIK